MGWPRFNLFSGWRKPRAEQLFHDLARCVTRAFHGSLR